MKEVAKHETKAVAAPLPDMADFAMPKFTARDIMLPKILAMHMTSKKVIAEEAAFGELRDSLNNEFLGNFKTPLEVVPFACTMVWVEYTVEGKEKKYNRIVPITPENDDLPYNEPGLSRDRTMNFYVMLPSKLDSPMGTLPHVVSFRRTSLKAGQKLASIMSSAQESGKTPASVVCELSVLKQVRDEGGAYSVMDIKAKRESTPEELRAAYKWYKKFMAGETKVEHTDIIEEENVERTMRDTETDQF